MRYNVRGVGQAQTFAGFFALGGMLAKATKALEVVRPASDSSRQPSTMLGHSSRVSQGSCTSGVSVGIVLSSGKIVTLLRGVNSTLAFCTFSPFGHNQRISTLASPECPQSRVPSTVGSCPRPPTLLLSELFQQIRAAKTSGCVIAE